MGFKVGNIVPIYCERGALFTSEYKVYYVGIKYGEILGGKCPKNQYG
jgi:hypothetical protein